MGNEVGTQRQDADENAMEDLADSESESSVLSDNDLQNKALYLCEYIKICNKMWKHVKLLENYENPDMKNLFAKKDVDGVRNFFLKEKRNEYKKKYPKAKTDLMFKHWKKFDLFANMKDYHLDSEKAKHEVKNGDADCEHTKLHVEPKLLTEAEREVLDELLTFRTDDESYSGFVYFLKKCERFEVNDRRTLFRNMLIERLIKKDIRKLEVLLNLDYDDKFTNYRGIFEALQECKKEVVDAHKSKLDGLFKNCPADLSFNKKFQHYVANLMKRAKRKHLIVQKDLVVEILKRPVNYENELTTPLALLCENATFDMFHALLVDTEYLDVWQLLQKASLDWTTPAIDDGPSLIHYAAMNPSDKILSYLFQEKLVDETHLAKETSRGKTPMHFAAQFGSISCINFILSKGEQYDVVNSDGETPLHMAATGGDVDTFNLLYRMYPEEEECLHREGKYGPPLLYAAKNNHYKCVGTIFDKQAEADATVHDEDCDTALHYISKIASTRWLSKTLKANALLGEKNVVGNAPIDWISRPRLEAVLDKHTTLVKLKQTKGDTSRKDHTEIIFTNVFGHHASGSDMKNIRAIAQTPTVEDLALHPLCQSIVSVKWQKMKKFFYLKLAFFLPFVIFLSLHPILQMQRDLNSSGNDNSTSSEQYDSWIRVSISGTYFFLAIQVVFGLLSLFVLVPPFFRKSTTYVNTKKLNLKRIRRLLEVYWEELLWSDWYEYVLWVIAFQHLANTISPIIVVIASWFSLFYVCSNHPAILPLRYMLVKILLRYIKFLIFSVGLIGGFALGFYLLVNKCKLEGNGDLNKEGSCAEGFDTLYMTMLKVPSMMMGEISFESFKFEASAHLQFLFGSFIFLITCCLFNMMNGLAINITTELERKAHIFSTIAQCEMIVEFEELLKEMHSWLKWLNLPGQRTISALWIERIKVKPSTGECKNLEQYDQAQQEHANADKEDLWETNDQNKAEWIWIDRKYTLKSSIVRAALERCRCTNNVYKDPADVEVTVNLDDDDEDGSQGINILGDKEFKSIKDIGSTLPGFPISEAQTPLEAMDGGPSSESTPSSYL